VLCVPLASLHSLAAQTEPIVSPTEMIDPELYENSIFAPAVEEVAETDEGIRYVSDTLMLLFETGIGEEQMRSLVEAQGGEAVGYNSALDMMQVRVIGDSYEQLQRQAQRYNTLRGVQFATPSVFADICYVPNDPWEGDLSDSSWTDNSYRDSNWNMDLVNVSEAWDLLGYGSTASVPQHVLVGVIDNELDVEHPEFIQSDDDLVVRYLDDEKPDKIGNMVLTHGSHVTGIIAASPNNTQYITGIFHSGEVLFSQSHGDIASLLIQFERMVNAGAKVLNFSWGLEKGTASQAEQIAVPFALSMKKLFDNGFDDFLVVQSAGNNGHDATLNSLFATINASANFQAITGCNANELQKMMDRIVVAAAVERPDKVNGRLEYCSFSNNGFRVDIAAPGGSIVSTAPLYLSGSSGLVTKSGTSMSAAHVSGVAGLLWSANPNLSAPLIKQILCANSQKVDGQGRDFGAPLLDAELSVRMALNTHFVQFDLNGGEGSIKEILTRSGEPVLIPSIIPIRAGHTFLGWSEQPTETTPKYAAGKSYIFNEDMTLYAIWRVNVTNYTVIYNTRGGSPTTIAPVTVVSGVPITLSTAPTKSGNIFKGWKTGNTTFAAGASYIVIDNVTFTAQWAKTIFSTKHESSFLTWFLFIVCFGWIWMWFG